MPSAKDRRSPRVHVALDVSLQTVDGDVPYKTKNASYEGVFILSQSPMPLRKLIRFRTHIAESGEELQMLGLVAHTVSAADAQETNTHAGMGVQLFSLGRETRERWRDYVDELYEQSPEARQTALSRPKVRLRIPSPALLQRFRSVDLPRGGLFLRTPEIHPEDTLVDCVITHPLAKEQFLLQARVTECVDGSIKERGIRLDFVIPDDRSALDAFLEGDVTPPSVPES